MSLYGQLTKLESNSIVDSYEPLVQGLDPKNITRTVSAISIVLSKDPLDTADPGYQAPLPASEVIYNHVATRGASKRTFFHLGLAWPVFNVFA